MKILIVEDQLEKAADISRYLQSLLEKQIEIIIEESLRSGLMFLASNLNTDLVVLDMSMPVNSAAGAEPVSFAGRELMKQMQIRDITIPAIVVTQYSIFEKDNETLEGLDREFRDCFGNFYIGAVYYSSASGEWKKDFSKIIKDKFK